MEFNETYPLVMTNSLLWKMTIEIVSFLPFKMVIFHSFFVCLPEGKPLHRPYLWICMVGTSNCFAS